MDLKLFNNDGLLTLSAKLFPIWFTEGKFCGPRLTFLREKEEHKIETPSPGIFQQR